MTMTPPTFPRFKTQAPRTRDGEGAARPGCGRVFELKHYRHRQQPDILRPADNPPPLALSYFSSPVPAGFPSPADDYIEGQLDLHEYLVHHPSATFYVRVTGESMNGAGIFPNDLLVVDRALEAQHGSIVIAVVDGDLTVKRLHRKGNAVELHSENPAFPAITFTGGMQLSVWGVVSGVVRKF